MTAIALDGKNIMVVGAGGRLGGEVVRAVLRAGGNVLAVDTNYDALAPLQSLTADGERLVCSAADITSAASINAAFDLAAQRLGVVHGAVNSAYPRNSHYGRPFLDVTYPDFCENLSLHLGGYFLFMQQSFKYCQERKSSFSLVNFSSIYGVMAPRFEIYSGTAMTMPVEYAAIKSAVQHLSQYANALAKSSKLPFRANSVSPGGILAGQHEDFLAKYNAYCRTKGMLDAKDVMGAVLFLLSDAAEFVVGQNLVVDDGFSL